MALESGRYNGSTSFTLVTAETDSLAIASSYVPTKGSRYEPQVGHWSYWTQAICNNYPIWHAARRNTMGRTQTLQNHAAIHLEDVQREMVRLRQSLYLATANTFAPDYACRIPIRCKLRLSTADFRVHNLLKNSDFSIPGPARYGTPLHWSDRGSATTGVWTRHTANSLAGSVSMKAAVDAGEMCYLRQETPIAVGANAGTNPSITASVWILVPFPTTRVETTGELVLTIVYEDGTGTVSKTSFPTGTAGAWKRVSVTGVATNRVIWADFQIKVSNSAGTALEAYLAAPQLEVGTKAKPWYPNPFYMPHWWSNLHLAPVNVAAVYPAASRTVNGITYDERAHVRVWVTSDTDDWWEKALPTRIGNLQASSGRQAMTRETWGFRADPDNRLRYPTKFKIGSNKVQLVERATTQEVIHTFQLAERHLDRDPLNYFAIWGLEDGTYTITLEALTVHRDLLWIVCKETYRSVTQRVLKVCRTASNAYCLADDAIPDYLEVIQDYPLSISSNSCTAVGFVEGRDDLLLMTINGTEYEAALWYDYAFFSEGRLTDLLLRHSYDGAKLVTS